MKYIRYQLVDRQFGVLPLDLHPGVPFNGVDPMGGITFVFANESQYPIPSPGTGTYYGTVEDDAVADRDEIGLKVLSEEAFEQARDIEMKARQRKEIRQQRAHIPKRVAIWKMKIALFRAGLLPKVEQVIAALANGDAEEVRIRWMSNGTIGLEDETVQGVAAAAGIGTQTLDELFIAAATVR